MCRILGYISKEPKATVTLLVAAMKEFRALAKKGCVPCGSEPGHLDGWGITAHKAGALELYYRATQAASDDAQYATLLGAVQKLEPDVVIVHLRKTSAGGQQLGNAQPFVTDNFSFCHNGTIVMPKAEASDSLRFFRGLVKAGATLAAFERWHQQTAKRHKITAMNMFASDGAGLVVAQNWNAQHENVITSGFEAYYTLHELSTARATFICSEPLAALKEAKHATLKNQSFYRYAAGKRVSVGKI